MAFSTQKDFFNVPFMNEDVELDCKKACVKLKRYESTIDNRAWANDETKQSKFLSDLVTCQVPFEGDGSVRDCESGAAAVTDKLTAGDSLLECANVHLAEYQKILNSKQCLEKQLEVSKECLKTAKQENLKIREILASKLDSNTAKEFYNKIQKYANSGKFNKNEENEMIQIYKKMENMNKAYEILQAENNYLKRLIEKLSARVKLDNIEAQPEKSTDVEYLQKEVNNLRKECIMLRQLEDDFQKLKQQRTNNSSNISERDAENIKAIIKERNCLREKCKTIKALEKKVEEAKNETANLNNSLSNQKQYCNKMEDEMQNMQRYYENKKQSACLQEDCLKAQIEDLKDELIKARCEAQKSNMLAMEVSCLRNEILKRDLALNDYDCQYQQLMEVVNELQAVKLQCLNDNQTQTNKDQTDELAFYASATLNEMMKEMKSKGEDDECCEEMKRLQQQIEDMKKSLMNATDYENMCADAIKRLKELEAENAKLREAEKKLAEMMKKIESLEEEINKTGKETEQIGKDLEGAVGLVKDISDVQLKNQQLTNAVNAINTRDDQKIIDDLRRQLEEELAKLKKCQEDNSRLSEEIKEIKNLNNKLLADKKKLEADNEKLSKEISNINKKKKESLDQQKEGALDDFVSKKTDDLKSIGGKNFEKEFRKILEEFIQECSYCFCRMLNTKSKLYSICHKLSHCGIEALSFRELAYLHKKIYAQADQLLPGCLLDMILSEHKEHVERILSNTGMQSSPRNNCIDSNISDARAIDTDQKCCCCKSELCCNNSEEMLKEKVNKLEKDIEIAREYLENLKNMPIDSSVATDNGDSTDTNNSTYRPCSPSCSAASSPIKSHQKTNFSKHLKKIKTRMSKYSDI